MKVQLSMVWQKALDTLEDKSRDGCVSGAGHIQALGLDSMTCSHVFRDQANIMEASDCSEE